MFPGGVGEALKNANTEPQETTGTNNK